MPRDALCVRARRAHWFAEPLTSPNRWPGAGRGGVTHAAAPAAAGGLWSRGPLTPCAAQTRLEPSCAARQCLDPRGEYRSPPRSPGVRRARRMLGRWGGCQAPSSGPGLEVKTWNPDSGLAGGTQ